MDQVNRISFTEEDKTLPFRTALVTGGAGFIGSYLVEQLINAGVKCSVLDCLFHDSLSNLSSVLSGITLHRADLRSEREVAEVFATTQPEAVFHLAAHHFIPYCDKHPVDTVETNIIGTQMIADACARFGTKRLFYASTAAVYAPSSQPHNESEIPHPPDIYGASKYAGERIVKALSANSRVIVRVGRYFNAVGPRETNLHIVPEIMRQLMDPEFKALRLGNLFPKRDYVHAADLASGSIRLLSVDTPGNWDVANIGSGKAASVADLIGMFEKALGRPIPVENDPAKTRVSDRPLLVADTTRMKQVYGWQVRRSLDEAVAELVETLTTQ